jgi:hypothetical protein
MRFVLIVPFAAMFACLQVPPPPVTTITIADPMSFLVQAPENGGRHDWPLPVGYVALSNVAEGNTRARQTWDFAPFGSYEPERGDGFQVAEVGGDGWVRFTSTRDGGTPWVQHFVGQACGGTGWLVFGVDAPTGSWREVVATLNIAQDPATCPPSLNPAFTRYRLELVEYPFAVAGMRSSRTVQTVISEHYDHKTIAQAGALERTYLGQGYGLLRWEAWGQSPQSIPDLPERCGPVAYSEPPQPGWYLRDCRTYSNVMAP